MRKILYLCAGLLFAFGWGCSYDDHSTGPDKPVSDLMIDTTGIPARLTANFGVPLVIEPGVSSADNPDNDFSYEWRMSLYSNNSTTQMSDMYKIVGTEKNLNYVMDLPPDAVPYQLWYRVTDNRNEQLKTIMWLITVEASSGQGLLVAHSEDGTSSDLSVIQDTLFTAAFIHDEGQFDPTVIKRNVYSQANGGNYPGIIREMNFQPRYYDRRLTNYLDATTGDHYFRVNLLDFTKFSEDQDLFLMPDPVIDIRKMIVGSYTSYPSYSTNRIIWNNRGFQRMSYIRSDDPANAKAGYGIPSVGSWAAASTPGAIVQYDPDPKVSWGTSYFMFYDKMNGRFIYLSTSFSDGETVTQCQNVEGEQFNPSNLPGLEILEGGYGDNLDHRFIVKEGDSYKIYSISQATGYPTYLPAKARTIIDITAAPEIDKAEHFVVCTNQPVVYYATSTNNIYSIFFLDGLGVSVSYRLEYTSPEPINGLYLLRRSGSKALSFAQKAMIMTTSTGQSDGKVWFLPMGTIGTGELDRSRIVSFEGFGRISAVAMID